MKKILFLFAVITFSLTACHKAVDNGGSPTQTFDSLEAGVINDFTNTIVFSGYSNLLNACLTMQTAVAKLRNESNDVNLSSAKAYWKNMRAEWEQREGFLLGPVESNDYDPNTDAWPTDALIFWLPAGNGAHNPYGAWVCFKKQPALLFISMTDGPAASKKPFSGMMVKLKNQSRHLQV